MEDRRSRIEDRGSKMETIELLTSILNLLSSIFDSVCGSIVDGESGRLEVLSQPCDDVGAAALVGSELNESVLLRVFEETAKSPIAVIGFIENRSLAPD